MAKGKLTDDKLTRSATLSGAVCAAELPLDNLKDDSRFVGAPARFIDCDDISTTRFDLTLPEPRLVNFLAPLFHTMTRSALYRITACPEDDPDLTDLVLDTGWQFVFPSVYDPWDLEFGVDNGFDGALSQSDLDLVPRHMWAPQPEMLAQRIRFEFDDRTNEQGWFDIGGLWTASAWSAEINYDRGRDLTLIARDQLDEAPSGRVFAEERLPRRQLAITYGMLATAEAQRVFDTGLRARSSRPVIFVPDSDDQASMLREAFPATLGPPPGAKFIYPSINATALTLKEILA